jgi:luciferase family oxidoreductase group 1
LLLSALDLVPLVEGGTSEGALADSAALAQALDRLGYARLWYAEHHNMPGIAATTPEVLIARAGTLTKRIRLGAGGVMLPNHSPLKVAETYKLLETMYPGRIDLGIGRAPGTDRLTALALRRSREAMQVDDFPLQLEELLAWGGKGEFPADSLFRKIRAMPDDKALPPLYMLGSSDYGARVAAQIGVGFAFAGHFSTDRPEFPMHAYRGGFQAGQLERPHAILALPVYCAETEAEAHRIASSILLSFARLRTGRPGRLPSVEEATSHVFTPQEQTFVEFYETIQVVGTPEQVKRRIEQAVERTAADEVMLVTHTYEVSARIRSFELVAEAFGLSGHRQPELEASTSSRR